MSVNGRLRLLAIILLDSLLLFTAPLALMKDNPEWYVRLSMMYNTVTMMIVYPRFIYIFLRFIKVRRVVSAAFSLCFLTVLLYGSFITRTDYECTTTSLTYKNIPESFDGYRIVFFADLHIGSLFDREREVDEVVSLINRQEADLVIFGGDLVYIRNSEITPKIKESLKRIKSRDGVIFVEGNHDCGVYVRDTASYHVKDAERDIIKTAESIGWTTLLDSTIYIRRLTDSISVSGVDFSFLTKQYHHTFHGSFEYNATRMYSSCKKGDFNLTISHMPQLVDKLFNTGYPSLILSGHTHAGQAAIITPYFRLSPSQLLYRRWSGLYRLPEGDLYITNGVGYVGFYIRIGAKPEISVIELHSSR